ncbi:MAG: amidohydrolase [Treponema sp.]|jgi:aminobenzoyl-glutamate utilization protein A|nr:amidohydrolase [Treponema sp.]
MLEERIVKTMIARRRDFHRYPEAGWEEFRTTAKIAEILIALGYDVHFASEYLKREYVMGYNINAEAEKKRAEKEGADPLILQKCGDYTGLYADFDTGCPGPFTVFRFDIDCVETAESPSPERLPVKEGFVSCRAGRHHACAHDGHTAIGLALAELVKKEPSFSGRFRFLFQPAEEGVRGGYAMTRAGLVDGADYFLSLHLGLGTPTGVVYGGLEGFLYSTKFDADFTGRGAHSGVEPEKGKNALLGAAAAALGLHAIAPHSGGKTFINVGVLNAGEGRNVVPPKAYMKIEIRGETTETAEYMYRRSVEILEGSAKMYDLDLAVIKQGEAITVNSSPELAAIVTEEAAAIPGVKAQQSWRMIGSEDASWMMKRVQDGGGKASYAGVGADITAGHHNSAFDFDEAALPVAVETLFRTVKRLHG